MTVVLIGFMGAGKTTVGHIIAERLGQPFIDSDVYIEQQLGRSIREVFEQDGEKYFREIEHATIRALVSGPDAVVAVGGGAVEDPRTRALLADVQVVYLRVSYSEAMGRVQGDKFRPVLSRPNLDQLYQARLPSYAAVSGVTVDTDGRRPDAVALDVLVELNRLPTRPPNSSSVLVTPVGGTYYAHIGPKLLQHLPEILPVPAGAERAMIVSAGSDGAVAAAVGGYLKNMGLAAAQTFIPDTQASKTFRMVEHLADVLADHAMHRDDLIVAVGGEAVCDIVGFLSATFNRGMKLVLIPTTLLAQADSSVGGKNAVNLSRGRNLVGTIHQPIVVISDTELSCANSDREFMAGLAEIVKHGLISQTGLLQELEADAESIVAGRPDAVTRVTVRSVEIKAGIVSRDEREQGERVHLNYGHTFAHAAEFVTGLDRDDQGASVSLGMMAAAHLAFRQGRLPAAAVEQHRRLLSRLGLPTRGSFDFGQMEQAWLRDKKYRHGIRFVVLNGLGKPEGGVTAERSILQQVLADLAGS